MNITIQGQEIKLNDTCQLDHFYKSVSDFPKSVYELLINSKPYVVNNSYTCYEAVTFIDINLIDDSNNNSFKCHISFEGNQLDNDCLFEWLADQDLRLELI